jgi:hypothetical protein
VGHAHFVLQHLLFMLVIVIFFQQLAASVITRENDVLHLVAQQQVYECSDHYNLQNLVGNPTVGYKLRVNALPYANGQRPTTRFRKNMESTSSLQHPIFRAANSSAQRNADTSPGKRLATVLQAAS